VQKLYYVYLEFQTILITLKKVVRKMLFVALLLSFLLYFFLFLLPNFDVFFSRIFKIISHRPFFKKLETFFNQYLKMIF